jgi:hypothetical protein
MSYEILVKGLLTTAIKQVLLALKKAKQHTSCTKRLKMGVFERQVIDKKSIVKKRPASVKNVGRYERHKLFGQTKIH